MLNPVSTILYKASRKPNDKLNILTFCTHERYETGLCLTGHNFYAYRGEGIKDWNTKYANIPENYILLDPNLKDKQLPIHVDFDLVLSQNKFGQFQVAKNLSNMLQLPLISLEHTLPPPNWTEEQLEYTRYLKGNINVFISEYSINKWKWGYIKNTKVITHMVDTDIFYPDDNRRKNHILSVVNDWVNRDWCCNFQGWQRVTQGLPVKVLGDTPGLSKPAPTTKDLADEYRKSKIFINTSTISPVPTALLEAMASGCACVSTATCMIPNEVIKHGENGLISNDENELRQFCIELLNNDKLCRELGEKARQTILTKFNKETFIEKWNKVFYSAANIPFIGD